MPETLRAAVAAPAAGRDPRLDVLRGLSLVMIFINHTPGQIYENLTSRNFGFSDAAEGFVLMSGIAAGLAYMRYFAGPGPYWAGVARLWRRSWTLYKVHLVTTALALGVAAATAQWFGGFGMMQLNEVDKFYEKPLQFLIGIPTLAHQLGYANILPLYAALLLVAPGLIWLALRAPRVLLAGSLALWFITPMYWLNMPSYPNGSGWFLNPFAWQLLFVLGLLTGVAAKHGQRFVPVKRWLVALCIVWLIFCAAAAIYEPLELAFGHVLWLAAEKLHFPWIAVAFDKTYLTVPRLSHALALAYVLSVWPAVRQACASRFAAPFALLGRHALPVFGLGVVLCYTANGVKTVMPQSLALDTALIGTGIALMLALAGAKEAWKRAEARAQIR